jgi:MFS family permease
VPPEFPNFASEVVFVLICSAGQLLFAWFLGDVNVNQVQIKAALGIPSTQLPWLVGAFNIANGLSVMLSGSVTDLVAPKFLIVGAFVFLSIWNVVGAFSLTPSRSILFFIVRAMQGLAVGTLVSGSMSILGRVYNPGLRKTRVFSCMAAMAPFGFWIGALQGGALTAHLPWIFGSNAMLCTLCAVAAFFTIPALKPAVDTPGAEAPSLRQFDFIGAALAVSGSVCLLFGLTQGSVSQWSPYTYALVVIGVILLAAFFFAESRVARPLIPTRLWKTPGFAPLMAAYFVGFGAYISWQFYAIQFWLRIQQVSPLTVALYLLPNALVGVLATYIVSRIMHIVPGHWIYVCAMVAFGLGPAFFLPQTANTSYFALSMPGVALCTFGPDLSFAAASIFITSNVARSYQGSAGSLLMTVQNLSAAIVTSVADVIGAQVDLNEEGEVGLEGLRAIWWFGLAAAMLGAVITVVGVRIPKEEEKEHVT